ncbi:hypothetical protein [Pseudomonas sp. NMI542_15]|uniref:hypothetical protein n=1 Tax=Pseudomonas sp. NMI542_15 TaxID=2903148 RepID=UPI001E2D2442|nr:hypothetical protein [Pseudomonas sp. NMI542_15]MCE0780832.1 hypothetical protein [Pseudomonas sp. NMI542_15]
MTSITKIQKIISDLQAAERDLHLDLSSSREGTQASRAQACIGHDMTLSTHEEEVGRLNDQLDKLSSRLELVENQNKDLESELETLRTENKSLAQQLYDAQKESILNRISREEASQENETLISKILQVQIELEEYYQDKVSLELALGNSTLALDKARIAICSLNAEK